MTTSREKFSLELGSSDESEIESFAAPRASLSPLDTLTSQWCVMGMRDIYTKDMYTTKRGNPAHSIYEETRVISARLGSVFGHQDTIRQYRLQWHTKSLGRCSPTMVSELYVSYASTIQSTLPKGKNLLAQPRLTQTRVRG